MSHFKLTMSLTAILLAGVIGVCMHPYFCKKENLKYRAILFGLLGSLGFPLEFFVKYYLDMPTPYLKDASYLEQLHVPWKISLVGLIVYATRTPERWFPKRFDFFIQSHTFMHLAVTAACYYGIQTNISAY